MVLLLGSSPFPLDPAAICALATMTSLLGRAIESQKLANQLASTCRALDSELKAAAGGSVALGCSAGIWFAIND